MAVSDDDLKAAIDQLASDMSEVRKQPSSPEAQEFSKRIAALAGREDSPETRKELESIAEVMQGRVAALKASMGQSEDAPELELTFNQKEDLERAFEAEFERAANEPASSEKKAKTGIPRKPRLSI